MKKILLLALLVLGFGMNAQKKTVDISKTEIGKLNAKHSLSIDLEKKDTIAYVYLGFQNEKYKSISDRKSILFRNQEEVNAFIKDLKTAFPEMETKQNINWKKEKYSISLYDFSFEMYLSDKPSSVSGYTLLTKKDVENLITWLEKIQFGK
jgi:hypothetical protein